MAQVKAYNTKTGKFQVIHPSHAKDKVFLAQRGLILEEQAKAFRATNVTEPVDPVQPTKTKTSK